MKHRHRPYRHRHAHWHIKRINVYCSECKEWIDEKTVEFVNIEEDFQGRDKLTFNCPNCKTRQKSLRRG